MDHVIRPLTTEDEPILWEMVYQGLHTSEGATVSQQEVTQRPELARYVEGWGRAGDAGFVAHDAQPGGGLLGAVWSRLPNIEQGEPGDETEATPELAFAVKPALRKRGLGAALLTRFVKANPQQSTISINVGPNNPAVRLYERFGFKVVRETPGHVTMRREA
jgi:ribosomal protein S18 acetylase RimI-like enzyme